MTVYGLEAQPTTPLPEHDCPYENRAEWYLRHMGGRGIASANALKGQVASLHAGGECPPTHVGTGPTREWEDIINSTRI